MRIALISPLFESVPPRLYGGTERVVSYLCRGLRQYGIDITLFASGDSDPGVEGVELVPVLDQALRLRAKPVFDPFAYNFRALALVRKRARDFDVIHNHHDYWMLPLSEMCATPLVTTLHGRLDLPDIPAAFLSYPKCSFVSISDAQREPMELLNWVRTVRHGLPLEDFHFSPRPGNYLAFLGRISRDKRPDWAIEIAKRSGVPLKIAAKIEGAEMLEYFETFVKPHIDGKFIEYVGEISDHEKCEFLGNALATVFPIDWPEPFGLVVIESLACGTPILSRPCGSLPELLKDGVTGYSSLSIQDLAARVDDVSRLDRTLCRQWVEDRFSLPRMVEDYIDVYGSLASTASLDERRVGDRRNFLHSV